ncbi:MAG: hypothetical protein ACTHK0_11685 [Ginsengibacter sp.]
MSEKNQHKKTVDKEEQIEQHKKSKNASSSKDKPHHSNKNVKKTGTKDDDWNDPTGNSHLAS